MLGFFRAARWKRVVTMVNAKGLELCYEDRSEEDIAFYVDRLFQTMEEFDRFMQGHVDQP